MKCHYMNLPLIYFHDWITSFVIWAHRRVYAIRRIYFGAIQRENGANDAHRFAISFREVRAAGPAGFSTAVPQFIKFTNVLLAKIEFCLSHVLSDIRSYPGLHRKRHLSWMRHFAKWRGKILQIQSQCADGSLSLSFSLLIFLALIFSSRPRVFLLFAQRECTCIEHVVGANVVLWSGNALGRWNS